MTILLIISDHCSLSILHPRMPIISYMIQFQKQGQGQQKKKSNVKICILISHGTKFQKNIFLLQLHLGVGIIGLNIEYKQ